MDYMYCITFSVSGDSLTGATMTVILDLPYTYSVWISSSVAIIYTLLGGLYSVAYTDVIQLCLIFFSLVSYKHLTLPRLFLKKFISSGSCICILFKAPPSNMHSTYILINQ